jgi:hypothetical protein
MKITSFEVGGKAHYGVVDNVIDLPARLGPGYSSISGRDTCFYEGQPYRARPLRS